MADITIGCAISDVALEPDLLAEASHRSRGKSSVSSFTAFMHKDGVLRSEGIMNLQ